MATKIKGGGARKYDRNRVWCKSYRESGRSEKAKARRLIKHLSNAPWDGCARAAFDKLPITTKGKLTLPPLAKSPAKLRKEMGVTLTAQIKLAA